MTAWPARLGVAYETQSGFSEELSAAVAEAARELGADTRLVDTAEDEGQVDVVLAIGNVRLFPDLLIRSRRARRVLWHGETLPRPTPESGSSLHRWLPTGRLLDATASVLPAVARSARWRRWREQAALVREPLANLVLLRRHAHVFDRLVIDTYDRAEGALRAGLSVDVVPYGYHAKYAGALSAASGERDIAVLSLAHMVGRVGRRQRMLGDVEAALRASAIELVRVEADTYGARRRALLERTRVVVDVHRLPGNHPLFRFIVAAAAGAALVSEPLVRPEPLVPGVHYVEAPTSDLAAAARALLADEARRRRVVEAAQTLLLGELDLRRTLPRALG